MIIHDVEQGSFGWLELRLGKITGSRLKKICSTKSLDVVDELIDEIETGRVNDDGYVSEAMQRGTDLEPLAIKVYETMHGVKARRVGFCQSDTMPMVGMSPDALIGDDGAVEVKCPDTVKHIRTIRHNKLPSDHKHQVAMYFIVHEGLQWLDFMSYDPRLTKRPVFIYRVTRESIADEIAEYTEALQVFIAKFNKIQTELFF